MYFELEFQATLLGCFLRIFSQWLRIQFQLNLVQLLEKSCSSLFVLILWLYWMSWCIVPCVIITSFVSYKHLLLSVLHLLLFVNVCSVISCNIFSCPHVNLSCAEYWYMLNYQFCQMSHAEFVMCWILVYAELSVLSNVACWHVCHMLTSCVH
jgi:amino acid transporter